MVPTRPIFHSDKSIPITGLPVDKPDAELGSIHVFERLSKFSKYFKQFICWAYIRPVAYVRTIYHKFSDTLRFCGLS